MRDIKESGMPSAISARSISRARHEEANRESPPYGTLMQTRMLPIERLVPRFRRIVRQTARELEKQIRVLKISVERKMHAARDQR